MIPKARFEIVHFGHDTIYIVDKTDGHHMSITNDAERVVAWINERWPGKRIVYRDTEGRWDELKHEDGIFKGFGAWTGYVPDEAAKVYIVVRWDNDRLEVDIDEVYDSMEKAEARIVEIGGIDLTWCQIVTKELK